MWLEEVEVDRVGVKKKHHKSLLESHTVWMFRDLGEASQTPKCQTPYPLARSFILIKM